MTAQIVDAACVEANIGKMALIDCRTPEEYDSGHIPSALNIPFEPSALPIEKQAEALVRAYRIHSFNEADPMIIYCQTGRRAKISCDLLESQGWNNTYLYSGSYLDWVSDPARPIEVTL